MANVAVLRMGDWSADDLDLLPDDGNRYELIDGQLHVTPPPAFLHQRVATRLAVTLMQACPPELEVMGGPIAWRIAASTQLEPDLSVVPRAMADDRAVRTEVPPLLIVEVLSPSTRRYDLGTKLLTYADGGLRAYWIVDPEGPSVSEYRHDGTTLGVVTTVVGNDIFGTSVPFAVELTPLGLVD